MQTDRHWRNHLEPQIVIGSNALWPWFGEAELSQRLVQEGIEDHPLDGCGLPAGRGHT